MADDKKPTTRGGPIRTTKRTLLLGTPRPFKTVAATGENLPRPHTTAEVDDEADLPAVKGRTLPPQPVVVPVKGTATTATAPTSGKKPDIIRRAIEAAERENPADARVLLDLLGPDLGHDIEALITGEPQALGQPKGPEPVVVSSGKPSRDDSTEEKKRKEQEWEDMVEARVFGFKTLKHTPGMAMAKPDPPVAPARRDTPPMRPIVSMQAPATSPRAKDAVANVTEETNQAAPQSIFEIESESSLITEALQGVAESVTETEEPSAEGAEEETMMDEKPKADAEPAPAQSATPEAASAPSEPVPKESATTIVDATANAGEEMPADDLIVLDDAAAIEQPPESEPPVETAPAQSAAPEAASAPDEQSAEEQPVLEQPLEPEPQQPAPAPPPADPFAPVLVMTGSDMSNTQRFEMGEFQHYVIGRGEECDLVLDALTVSRTHAAISRRNDGEYTIRDLGSATGTVLKDKKVAANTEEVIHSNDRFDISGFKFIFFNPAEEKRRADEAKAAKEAAKTVAKPAEAKKKAGMAVTTDLAGAPPAEEPKPAAKKKPEEKGSNVMLWAIAASIALVIGAIWLYNRRPAPATDSSSRAKVSAPAVQVASAPKPAPAPKAPAVKPPPAETVGELQVAAAEPPAEDDPINISDKGYKPAEKSPIAKYASGEERPRQPKDCFPKEGRLRAQDVTWCCANLIPPAGTRTSLKDIAQMSKCMIWKEEAKLASLGEFNE